MKRCLFYGVFILCCCLYLFGLGNSENLSSATYKEGDKIRVKGTIKMVGNEPFTEMVIESDETGQLFYLPVAFKKQNLHLIAAQVEMEGNVSIVVSQSADHKYRITKVYLNDPIIK